MLHGITALLLVAVVQPPAAGRAAVDVFERAAAAPETFFDAGCVLYDRIGASSSCEHQAGTEIAATRFAVRDLVALTRHTNPRVRTLALAQLFERTDPTLLPAIFALTEDTADTFPAHTPFAYVSTGAAFADVPKTAQTVGSIAEAMVRFYIERAGYSYGSRTATACPAFADYWQRRKDRAALASWFTVQLDRATQGTTPIPENRVAAFAALRARLEQLRGNERLWYSLHVGASEGGERVFTEAETMAFATAIGPDRLMQMLAMKEPAFDPDLVPIGRPGSCGAREVGQEMQRFVLERAPRLLRPSDADAVLQSPHAAYSLWSVAAAALRPDRAEAILRPRIETLDRRIMRWDQARMAAGLARFGGPSQIPYVFDWFHGGKPGEPVTNAQEIFIRDVVERSGSGGRALLQQLVQDSRFDTISAPALRTLIASINTWLPAPLVQDPYQSAVDEAATFAEWRNLVRQSAARWK